MPGKKTNLLSFFTDLPSFLRFLLCFENFESQNPFLVEDYFRGYYDICCAFFTFSLSLPIPHDLALNAFIEGKQVPWEYTQNRQQLTELIHNSCDRHFLLLICSIDRIIEHLLLYEMIIYMTSAI